MRRLLLLVVLLVLPAGPAGAAPHAGFRWPLAGSPSVVRGFEPPRTRYGTGHRGVDLAASAGEAVLAAGPGRITYAGVLAGRGVVTVTHDDGLRTTYEPVIASVSVGRLVHAGSTLGVLGTGGHSSCTCLHWGLLRGETYLDPLSLLRPTSVRLLPVNGPPSPPLEVARPESGSALTSTGRSVGGAVATGALLAGVSLLLRHPAPPEPPPVGTLVDLRLERRRRRAA